MLYSRASLFEKLAIGRAGHRDGHRDGRLIPIKFSTQFTPVTLPQTYIYTYIYMAHGSSWLKRFSRSRAPRCTLHPWVERGWWTLLRSREGMDTFTKIHPCVERGGVDICTQLHSREGWALLRKSTPGRRGGLTLLRKSTPGRGWTLLRKPTPGSTPIGRAPPSMQGYIASIQGRAKHT